MRNVSRGAILSVKPATDIPIDKRIKEQSKEADHKWFAHLFIPFQTA